MFWYIPRWLVIRYINNFYYLWGQPKHTNKCHKLKKNFLKVRELQPKGVMLDKNLFVQYLTNNP